MATHLRSNGKTPLTPAESKIVDTEIQNLIDAFGIRFAGRDDAYLVACERMGDVSADAYNARADELADAPAGEALSNLDPDFSRDAEGDGEDE